MVVHIVDDLVHIVQTIIHSLPGEVQAFVRLIVVRTHIEVGITNKLRVRTVTPAFITAKYGEYLEPTAEIAGAAPCGISSCQSFVELFAGLPESICGFQVGIAQREPIIATSSHSSEQRCRNHCICYNLFHVVAPFLIRMLLVIRNSPDG